MEITDIRIRRLEGNNKMKAIVSITIDDEFVLHDIKVVDGEKGLFIAMPSKKTADGEYRDIAHPIKTETIIDFLIQEVQSSQKELYDPNNKEKMFYHEKLIQMNLFLIYIIIKNYPFFINKRDTLEKYFRQLMCYKK